MSQKNCLFLWSIRSSRFVLLNGAPEMHGAMSREITELLAAGKGQVFFAARKPEPPPRGEGFAWFAGLSCRIVQDDDPVAETRSEEHTSELQSH